jgi:type IV pilus assembly protein PilQ
LTGNNDIITNIEDYVREIDQPVAQVVIEALVVDYNLDNTLQYGISMGTGDSATLNKPDRWYPGLDVTASGKKINNILNSLGTLNLFGKDINLAKLGKLPDNFYANIQALESVGIANVKSKPVLSAINGATASLKIGTTQNYILNNIMPVTSAVNSTFIQQENIQKIEANISFEITPWIGANNELTLEIKPDFETPIGQFSPDKNLIPAINKRSLVSTIRLKDGETVVLGGLIQESETNTQNKVPLLSDIPFIGSLFTSVDKKKSKGQLMIYITPKINYGDDFGSLYFNYSK